VTVNWKSLDIDNLGIFYTDANSFKFMRRDKNKDLSREYLSAANKNAGVASYFYPVTSGIFIED
jgi:hypothetical protein